MKTQILVVDDSPIVQRRIEHLLEKGMNDVVVTFADNGVKAIESVLSDPPTLIVSDMRMPQMNGLELVEALHKWDINIPVILMTSFGSEEIALEALRKGASGYVPKRRLADDLMRTINNLLLLSQKREAQKRVIETLTAVEYQFQLANDPDLVTPLVSHALQTMKLTKFLKGAQITRAGVALQEALSNAIYHGNLELDSELRQVDERRYYDLAEERRRQSPYADRKIRVVAKLTRESVCFTVCDDGPGFDSRANVDPEATVNLERIGGRGLLLIRSFMDCVFHNVRGNEITMLMRIPAPTVEGPRNDNPNLKSELVEMQT